MALASHTLARFVVAKRRQREFYDMVGVAVKSIGRLGIAQTDLLIAELESASPGVAVEAARQGRTGKCVWQSEAVCLGRALQ